MSNLRKIQHPTKQCVVCGLTKKWKEFPVRYVNSVGVSILRSECKQCRNIPSATMNERVTKYRDRVKAGEITAPPSWNREYSYWKSVEKRYGASQEEVLAKYVEQEGLCAICLCGIEPPPSRKTHIDHCHTTMEFRGLLCGDCNCGIGYLKDDVNSLLRAVAYLRKSGGALKSTNSKVRVIRRSA